MPLSFTPLPLRGLSQGIPLTSTRNSQKFAFLRFRVLTLPVLYPSRLRVPPGWDHCSLGYRQFRSLMQKNLSERSPSPALPLPWLGSPASLLRNCPQPSPVVSWIAFLSAVQVVEVTIRVRACKRDASCRCLLCSCFRLGARRLALHVEN